MITFNQYINSPRHWLNLIPTRYKLILITVYIIVVPFCPVYILLLMHVTLLSLWKLVFKDYVALCKNWIFTLLAVYSSYFIFASITSFTVNIALIIPCNFKISTYLINNWNSIIHYKLYIKYQSYNAYLYLPSLLTRSYLLIINYFSIYNLILLTTSSEELIINSIILITHNKRNINHSTDIILIVILSAEVINLLNDKLKNTRHSIGLRGLTNLQKVNSSYYLMQLIFKQYQKLYQEIIYHMIYTIYARELLFYRLDLWLIIS